jgi:hypothetical protein
MKPFIGILIILWVFLIVIKLVKRKSSNDRRIGYNFLSRLRTLSVPQKLFVICIALFDVIVIILLIQGCYFIFFKPTGPIIPIILTFIAFCVLASGLKLEKFWVILVTVLVLPALVLIWLFNSAESNSYATIESPTGEKIIIIEHREATLGETNHFYNFYSKTTFPGVMKKLNNETIRIMTKETSFDNLEILGVDNANWVDDVYVIFRSPYAETIVKLKH